MKCLYGRRVECRSFDVGDQVLVLRPLVVSLFEAKFDDLFTLVHKVSKENYLVNTIFEEKDVSVLR